MSHAAVAWAYAQHLPNPRKAILVALADFADEENSCFPGQKKLAFMVGITDRSVRNALAALETSGHITRVHRHREDGTRTSDRYTLAVGQVIDTPTPVDDPVDKPLPERPSGSGLPERGSATTGTTFRDYRNVVPGKEPPEEPSEENTTAAFAAGGVVQGELIEDEPAPLNPSPPEPSKPERPIEHRVTDAAYEATGKAFAFMAVRAIVKWAIHERGHTPAQVYDAVVGAYRAGRPITRTVIGQWLDGIAGAHGTNTSPSTADRMRETIEIGRRLQAEHDAKRNP